MAKRRSARQSSIYRKLELLLCDLMAICERIPKHSLGLQVVGSRMVNETMEAMAATEFALNTPGIDQRIAYISAVIHSMTIVKSCCRELYWYSRKEKAELVASHGGELAVSKKPDHGRVVSNVQYTRLLTTFGQLGREIGAWHKAALTRRMGQTAHVQ